jgi:3-isopropylmalate dehydratase small subunit
MALAGDPATARMTVDLVAQTVESADGVVETFAIDARRKSDLIGGIDEIARSLGVEKEIEAFEARRRMQQPWIRAIVRDLA